MSQQIDDPLDLSHLTQRQHLIIGVTTTILVLAIISYGLRLYAKRITAATVWWDDYAIGVGLVFAVIPCICNYVGLIYGFGRHADILPPTYPRNYSICLYVLLLAWIISETVIKFGILLFYWRVFPGKYFRWSVWLVGIFFLGCFIAGFIGFVLQCVPVKGFWTPSIHATCLSEIRFFDATASLGLVGDIILLIQPLPVIVRLKASAQTRMGLALVFLTGGLVVVISAFRLAALRDINPTDITYTNVAPGLWTSAEVTIGVVSANLPFMRPILGKVWRKASNIHASYKGAKGTPGTDDRQTLRGQGFARISPSGNKGRAIMGLTSTAQHELGDNPLDFELGMPRYGISVRTELECRIEEVRAERDIQEPPHLMIRDRYGIPPGGVDHLDRSSKSETDEEI